MVCFWLLMFDHKCFTMKNAYVLLCFALLTALVTAGQSSKKNKKEVDSLPAPFATRSVSNFSKVVGWKDGRTPAAPTGFTVTRYADGFNNPRWMYVTPNGDVLVVESNLDLNIIKQVGGHIIGAAKSHEMSKSADRITLLRDTDKDGLPDMRETFIEGLKQPFGVTLIGDSLYIANTDAVWRFPYQPGQTKITVPGQKIVDLPVGKRNQHWTRNIIASKDGSKIYIAIGAATNIGEEGMDNEVLRASILEINRDGSGLIVYASGLRNPVGMDWAPGTNTLWTSVNERDGLGDNLVPDYLTSVKKGGFYGWPYVYFGKHEDPRVKDKDLALVAKTIIPEVDLGSHTASLGLLFYTGKSFPQKYHHGAFVAQHGSWNRSVLSGYKVVFVPFKEGKPAGKPEDFLTGFIADLKKDRVYGRPTGLAQLPDGSLLLTDDVTNIIWRISYK
jgi:glucose/arabinose dehydrogenase